MNEVLTHSSAIILLGDAWQGGGRAGLNARLTIESKLHFLWYFHTSGSSWNYCIRSVTSALIRALMSIHAADLQTGLKMFHFVFTRTSVANNGRVYEVRIGQITMAQMLSLYFLIWLLLLSRFHRTVAFYFFFDKLSSSCLTALQNWYRRNAVSFIGMYLSNRKLDQCVVYIAWYLILSIFQNL